MPLLERESCLASLHEYARDARGGDGRLVLVGGEAGVGKSALVERLQAQLPDARWSWGACDGLFTPRPLGPLFDLAAQLGGELFQLGRARAGRDELFDALLRQINEAGTLNVVVVEDVHWADEATIDLLRFLGRRLRGAATLLIATYRDDSLTPSEPLRIALGELATHRSTRRIGLAPLSVDAVRILASGTGFEPAELYRLTSGNPFFVTEVVRAGARQVPASARDAVLARVARLDDAARAVLDAAAMVGSRIDPRLLESVTAGPPSAVDEVLSSGLLVGDGPSLRFRHEIARLTVEQAIATHRRAPLHARILAGLRASGCEDDARMAFHAEGAADAEAVLRHAPRAAQRAAELGSHREAAAQYERALRFAVGEQVADAAGEAVAGAADPTVVAGLYRGLANESSLVDRWADAADANERALTLWRAVGDRLREGETLAHQSRTMWRLCRGRDSIVAAEEAVAILEPFGPGRELAFAYSNLASSWMLFSRHEAAIELARRAQALAERLRMPDVLSDSLNTEACAAANVDREWMPTLHRALEIAIRHGLESQGGRAYANIHGMLCDQRRYAEAEPYFVDGMAYCDDRGISTYSTCMLSGRATALEQMGRWDEAARTYEELIAKAGASPINRICPLQVVSLIRSRRGGSDPWAGLDEATAGAEGTDEPQWIVPVRLARAEVYWLEGRLGEARDEVERAVARSADLDPWFRGAIAVWRRRLSPAAGGLPGPVAEPYRLQLAGDADGAAAAWIDLGCPYDAAMALLDSGREAALRRALGLFEGLGAVATARLARRAMRRLGLKSVPSGAQAATREHPLGLTRRERQVLDLICGGHTNAEIAARLFISAKTVDHHVSAVLAKLGAPTRNAAASQALRLGLVGAARG